ncbi:MAG: hypothetical protein ACREON_01065 [Gemmatimonadaceae bacterium]
MQLMIDGTWVVPRTSAPTLFVENAAKGVYLKQGLYRAAVWSGTSVAYLDALEDPLVLLVGALAPEADGREGDRRDEGSPARLLRP